MSIDVIHAVLTLTFLGVCGLVSKIVIEERREQNSRRTGTLTWGEPSRGSSVPPAPHTRTGAEARPRVFR